MSWDEETKMLLNCTLKYWILTVKIISIIQLNIYFCFIFQTINQFFLQPRYDAVLNPDRFSFTQPLVVIAQDKDELGTVNSNISYEITGGQYLNKFNINEYSGEITLNSMLIEDRNFKIADNIKNEYQNIKFLPAFILTVRAHDHGIPYQWSEVQVYIHNPDFLNRTVTFTIEDSPENIELRKQLIERFFHFSII